MVALTGDRVRRETGSLLVLDVQINRNKRNSHTPLEKTNTVFSQSPTETLAENEYVCFRRNCLTLISVISKKWFSLLKMTVSAQYRLPNNLFKFSPACKFFFCIFKKLLMAK